MNSFSNLIFSNNVFWTVAAAWLTASLLKVVFYSVQKKEINFRRLIGNGGMPSTHSASVVSLASAVGFTEGWSSTALAISLVLAIIVMIDAQTVRRAAGQQARIVNQIVNELVKTHRFPQHKLAELLGHTRLEVLLGMLLGIVTALLVHSFAP